MSYAAESIKEKGKGFQAMLECEIQVEREKKKTYAPINSWTIASPETRRANSFSLWQNKRVPFTSPAKLPVNVQNQFGKRETNRNERSSIKDVFNFRLGLWSSRLECNAIPYTTILTLDMYCIAQSLYLWNNYRTSPASQWRPQTAIYV